MNPPGNDAIADRCRARAAAIAPGATFGMADAQGMLPDGPDILCTLGKSAPPRPPGRTLAADLPVQSAVPLYELLGGVTPILGRPFGPGGWLHHVGERPCARSIPGLRARFWLKNSLVTPRVRRDRALLPAAAFVATVGGIGRLPAVGANAASALACLGIYAASHFYGAFPAAAATALASTLLCLLLEKAAARRFLSEDAREFVLDEVAGMAVALLFLPPAPPGWLFLLGLLAFRFFDVLKPGIQWVERLPVPGKIVWDDVLAGIYAGLAVLTAALLSAR